MEFIMMIMTGLVPDQYGDHRRDGVVCPGFEESYVGVRCAHGADRFVRWVWFRVPGFEFCDCYLYFFPLKSDSFK